MTIAASTVDLTTLEQVKSWGSIALDNHNDDADVQASITLFSQWVCNYTGVASFNQVNQVNEVRSGNGNSQMFVRRPPVVNVVSVTVSGMAIPEAGDWPSFGYYVADDRRSILIRSTTPPTSFNYTYMPGTYFNRRYLSGFSYGQGNVKLVYNAGFDRVPADLMAAATRTAALCYKHKSSIDLMTRALSAGQTTATTRYFMDLMRPIDKGVVEFYKRMAIITS
jgi:hypothetical protein